MEIDLLSELVIPAETRIVMLILDGLGGVPCEPGGKTELETARTPNLDALAARSSLGLTQPVDAGITVESGPGHLALFGYDPMKFRIGRGALEAIGVGLDLKPGDVAVRGNYCCVDDQGVVIDRRAGRIADPISREVSALLSTIIEDIEIQVVTVREHRLAIVLRGPELSPLVNDTDPLKNGYSPRPLCAKQAVAQKTARVLNKFIERSRKILAGFQPLSPANMLLLRGFDGFPEFPSFQDRYGLHAAGIAVYPTYRGIASLVGMQVLQLDVPSFEGEFSALEKYWSDFEFFYLHIKDTDLAGEDGDFERKVHIIEEVDALLPRLMDLGPDVIVVAGDHSTPALLKGHSWHPVPVLLYSRYVRADGCAEFGERACAHGGLGILPAKDIMPVVLANAGRLLKWSG